MPNCSRGTVRLVAYMLVRTLGWLDRNGEPVEQDIAISYREFVSEAGISRGAVFDAIKEAIEKGFINRLQSGTKGELGKVSQAAQFRLRWDAGQAYVKWLNEGLPHECRTKNELGRSEQNKIRTGAGSKTDPVEQNKNRTQRNTKQKNTIKQQGTVAVEELIGNEKTTAKDLLVQQGIASATADEIAESVSLDKIKKQIAWLKYRNVQTSNSGYLIAACLRDYSEPEQLKRKRVGVEMGSDSNWRQNQQHKSIEQSKAILRSRNALLAPWGQQSLADRSRWLQRAIEQATTAHLKQYLMLSSPTDHEPHHSVLKQMEIDLELSVANGANSKLDTTHNSGDVA